jgi:hypothetical protein
VNKPLDPFAVKTPSFRTNHWHQRAEALRAEKPPLFYLPEGWAYPGLPWPKAPTEFYVEHSTNVLVEYPSGFRLWPNAGNNRADWIRETVARYKAKGITSL